MGHSSSPDGAAVQLRHAVREFRNSQRFLRRTKAPPLAGLGDGKRWKRRACRARIGDGRYGKLYTVTGISVTASRNDPPGTFEKMKVEVPKISRISALIRLPIGRDLALAMMPNLMRG